MKQTGRAVLLWALALYAVTQLALVAAMSRWHPILYERAYLEKWQQLRGLVADEPDRPLVLMLGSSRTEIAFRAERLEALAGPDGKRVRAYNFGVPTSGPLHQWLHLQELLDAGIRPRLLLVEVLPPLFNAPAPGITSEENWVEAPWMSVPKYLRVRPYLAHTARKDRDWLEGRLAPWYAFRPQLQDSAKEWLSPRPAETPHDPWGWRVPEELTPEKRARYQGVAWNLFYHSLGQFQMGKGPRHAMRDLLARCRREGIPVALVLLPESTTFRSWYSEEGRAGPRRLVARWREDFRVDVIDATAWIADREFIDGHHLEPAGVEQLTARLREEVRRLLARNGQE